jgi:hypothetical protein
MRCRSHSNVPGLPEVPLLLLGCVCLELLAAYAVVGPKQSLFQIGDGAVCQRRHRLRAFVSCRSARGG